jgi:hypothetical protein
MKIMNLAAAMACAAGFACTAMGAEAVRISQFYAAGGNTGSLYNNDWVELYNSGPTTVDISGWSIQYASSAGSFVPTAGSQNFTITTGSIAPGKYFLVRLGAQVQSNAPSPAFADAAAAQNSINMSATAGKLMLIRNTTFFGTNAPCPPVATSIVDYVGFGGAASCREGTAATDNAPGPLGSANALIRNQNGCNDTDNNAANFSLGTPTPRDSTSPAFFCPGFIDCNNNGIPDNVDIANGAADCNLDGIPDSCQLASNDCNSDGILDTCQLAGNDCNTNGILDACDFNNGILTDANNNSIFDACEGAAVVEATVNSTVQPSIIAPAPGAPGGPRPGANGQAFFNIEGSDLLTFASYGALRFDVAGAIARFDTDFGVGGWTLKSAYLHLVQSNAQFSFVGGVEGFYSGNDTFDIAPSATPTAFFENFATDFSDRQSLFTYTFNPISNGTKEAYLFYELGGTNTAGGDAAAAELQSATGTLTLLLNATDTFTAATYAGITNAPYRGPSLVLFAQAGTACPCSADYDLSGGTPDAGDIDAFFADWLAGEARADADCSGGTPDAGDIDVFFAQWLNGGC